MPQDYAAIQRAVERLAAANDLGSQPIVFTVVSGTDVMQAASQLGLCQANACSYFGQLNPYVQHGPQINEALRQAYLLGTIEAWAHPNGTIEIARQTFRIYGAREDYLSCTLAHEMAHFLDRHAYVQSRRESLASREGSEAEPNLASARISRELEVNADRAAVAMMTNAGYPVETCLDELDFSHQLSGDGRLTESEFTHPGHEERTQRLRQFIDDHRPQLLSGAQRPRASTPGLWQYDARMNSLTFTPRPPR